MATTVAQITTRDMVHGDSPANDVFTKIDIPDAYRLDAKPFVQRPFYVGEIDFPYSAPRYTILNTQISELPVDIMRSNSSLMNMFKIGAYGRPDLVLNLSLAGTISHAGCVLVGIVPPLPSSPSGTRSLINTIMSGPHGFLFANEATSLVLPVPWYCNTDLQTLDCEVAGSYTTAVDLGRNGNYATLVVMVLNPLSPSTGSTTSLKIVVEACFKNFDIVVPTPRYLLWTPQSGMLGSIRSSITGLLDYSGGSLKRLSADLIDQARQGIKYYTGLHNPAITYVPTKVLEQPLNYANITDKEQYFEKMDPFCTFDRMTTQPVFNTMEDEMSMSHIAGKRQYVGTFDVNTDDPVGKLLWVRPISPFQGGVDITPKGVLIANNLELLHATHRGWSGDLKITIQSVMNNKQQCKLKVIKYYNPSVLVVGNVPVYNTIVNAPSHLLEFTQGGQAQEVSLPFLSRNAIMPCAPNMDVEALMHGVYYIYLAQPLVIADSSPGTVSFNVYIQGDANLTFYGYNINNMEVRDFDFMPQGGLTVMNAPQVQDNSLRSPENAEESDLATARLLPVHNVRSHVRRMYNSFGNHFTVNPGTSTVIPIPLAAVVGEYINERFHSPIETFASMYYGKNVGFKIRVKLLALSSTGAPYVNDPDITRLDVRFYYQPQVVNVNINMRSLLRAPPNAVNYPIFTGSGDLNIPLPFVNIAPYKNSALGVYEFVVPNTSYFKFVGGPDQFRRKSGVPVATSATSDYGTIICAISSASADRTEKIQLEFFVGLTDESRLGFHCIAPIVEVDKKTNIIAGTSSGYNGDLSNQRSPGLYYPV